MKNFEPELFAVQRLCIIVRLLAYQEAPYAEIAYLGDQLDYLLPMIIFDQTEQFGTVLTEIGERIPSCRSIAHEYLKATQGTTLAQEPNREAA